MKRIAFVCSAYNEKLEIESQLRKQNISNIDVFPYLSEPDDVKYQVIEYNVRPDKQYGIILDLAQCINTHGLPDEKYTPPEKQVFSEDNKRLLDEATKHLRMDHLRIILNPDNIHELKEISRDVYNDALHAIKSDNRKFTDKGVTTHHLAAKMELEDDPVVIITILAVLFDKIYCRDENGNNTGQYLAANGKVVKNFLNAGSIGWMSELWSELLPKQNEYTKNKFLKSLRTRGRNMLKNKASIWGIRFFIEYLIEQEKETITAEPDDTEETTKVVYEGFDDDDVPF